MLLEYPWWILFLRVNTKEIAFILGFLFGVLIERTIQVIIELAIVHHL